jgi:hypothetical protein
MFVEIHFAASKKLLGKNPLKPIRQLEISESKNARRSPRGTSSTFGTHGRFRSQDHRDLILPMKLSVNPDTQSPV